MWTSIYIYPFTSRSSLWLVAEWIGCCVSDGCIFVVLAWHCILENNQLGMRVMNSYCKKSLRFVFGKTCSFLVMLKFFNMFWKKIIERILSPGGHYPLYRYGWCNQAGDNFVTCNVVLLPQTYTLSVQK